MHEPAWKRLVQQLSDDGFESPYLERLRSRVPAAESARQDLAREVLSEIASALGRAEDKINASLLRLELTAREIDALAAEGARDEHWHRRMDRLVAEFNAEREHARQSLWELRVHREAVGFRRDTGLADLYPIPPPRHRPRRA
jgi:hypothetical protein